MGDPGCCPAGHRDVVRRVTRAPRVPEDLRRGRVGPAHLHGTDTRRVPALLSEAASPDAPRSAAANPGRQPRGPLRFRLLGGRAGREAGRRFRSSRIHQPSPSSTSVSPAPHHGMIARRCRGGRPGRPARRQANGRFRRRRAAPDVRSRGGHRQPPVSRQAGSQSAGPSMNTPRRRDERRTSEAPIARHSRP